MPRKVLGIACYVVAGFFVYMVSLLAFVNEPPTSLKIIILGAVCIPGLISLLVGLTLSRFQNWKRDIGVVLVAGAGSAAFVALTMVCLLMSPVFREMLSQRVPDYFFHDFVTGVSCILFFSGAGVVLIMASKRSPSNTPSYPDASH
jgi:formate hydrogenlyase subunit 3/multisubunit Na+/H+ antiporter MnhD subunit